MNLTTAVALCRPGRLLLAGLFLFLAAGTVLAAAPLGSVARAVETVAIGRGDVRTGDAVFLGDEFAVGRNGTLTILFNDESVLTLTPGSRARIAPGMQKGGKKRSANPFVIQLNGRFRWTPGTTLGQGNLQYVKDTTTFTPLSREGQASSAGTSQGSPGTTGPASSPPSGGGPASQGEGDGSNSSNGFAGDGGSGDDPGQPLVLAGGAPGGGNWIPADDGDGDSGSPFLGASGMPGGSGGAPGGGNWIPADDAMTSGLAAGTLDLGASAAPDLGATLDAGSLGLDSSALNVGGALDLGGSLAIDSATATIGEVGLTGLSESLNVTETLQVDSGIALDAATTLGAVQLDGLSSLDVSSSLGALQLDTVDSGALQVDASQMQIDSSLMQLDSTLMLTTPMTELGGTSLLEGTNQLAVPGL